jgi:hypothetical protein
MPNSYTLSYSEGVQGWPSFYSFNPDYMIGMNNYFYTFKGGNLYRHNVNELRNNFYGVQYNSRVISVFNVGPLENKLFKTLNLEGDDTWSALMETDIQTSGFIEAAWFEKKEASWFAFVRNAGTVPAQPSEYALRSVNGIGRSSNVTGTGAAVNVLFAISPTPTDIGSIVSIGDYLYYALPPSYNSPVLCGRITNIIVNYPAGNNKLIVDTTIAGGSVPPITTPYFMYIKSSVAESHGVLGHYCVFTLENDNVDKVELFAVESEVMKSYP